MEAATTAGLSPARELPGDKAGRIVEAMRTSVAVRGIAGSTFDHVAREAGVSRGLLHYYFGTKERLLIEVVRRECELRIDRYEEAIASAETPDAVLAALVRQLEDFLGQGPAPAVMFYEMMTLGQRNDEIAAEMSELGRRTRTHLADALAIKSEAGVLELRADPDAVASLLFALADGITIRRLTEPEFEIAAVMTLAAAAARAVLC
jgi:AcrR family transcriptional regulator